MFGFLRVFALPAAIALLEKIINAVRKIDIVMKLDFCRRITGLLFIREPRKNYSATSLRDIKDIVSNIW